MNIKELSDAELYALMNEAFSQLELAEGMEVIMKAPQLKLRMRQQAAKARAAFNEFMAEYSFRQLGAIEDCSLDELRTELADFA